MSPTPRPSASQPSPSRKADDERRDTAAPKRETAETVGLKRVLHRERKRAPQA